MCNKYYLLRYYLSLKTLANLSLSGISEYDMIYSAGNTKDRNFLYVK